MPVSIVAACFCLQEGARKNSQAPCTECKIGPVTKESNGLSRLMAFPFLGPLGARKATDLRRDHCVSVQVG